MAGARTGAGAAGPPLPHPHHTSRVPRGAGGGAGGGRGGREGEAGAGGMACGRRLAKDQACALAAHFRGRPERYEVRAVQGAAAQQQVLEEVAAAIEQHASRSR